MNTIRPYRPAGRYPRPGPPGSGADRDAERIYELHHPEWMLRDDLTGYPAHLHIAVAPQARVLLGRRTHPLPP
jgi:hypothetical protein